MSGTGLSMNRRTFLKAGGALGALAAVGGVAASERLFGASVPQAHAEGEEKIVWSQCNVNCGGCCVFQWHVRDGKVAYMETDTTGEADFQARACLRGRTMRRWLNSPDRLTQPMKRVGSRGEGKFEPISWDEAIDLVAEKLRYTIDTYGNEAIYRTYGSGMYSTTGNPSDRLLNCLGGKLGGLYDYSTHMLQCALPYLYGEGCTPYDKTSASSMTEAELHSDLVVMFGNSPAETRMGGANIVWDFARVREAVKARGGRIVNIDYRLNETSSGHADEWLPIRTGTDAALVSAIAHEWIVNDQVDLDFLHTYCVGYDEETMPESARGQNLSYRAYIMGEGYDGVEKTPEWAAPITQIPAETIRSLAEEIASAEAPFIVQGWGPQRHSNGESASRAICMLPILIGKLGLPGTNTGQREAEPATSLVPSLPSLSELSHVEAAIPVYQWLNAVDHGEEMTKTNAGIQGVDRLPVGIKFLWEYAGNCITNQHGDINLVHDILQDESKCEFILVWDTVMMDSAKYADLLLPDAMRGEQLNMYTNGYTEYYAGVIAGGPAQDPPGECRTSYDVMAEIADRLGVGETFTEGRTQEEWIRHLYEEGKAENPELPDTFDDLLEQGVYKRPLEPAIGFEDFRRDPVANPLETPSGKIEIYSEQLAEIAETWELGEGEVISPIPIFDPGIEGYGAVTEEFPLYASGFHHKSRTHSSFGFIEELEDVARQQVWINPIDAEERGIANNDLCSVTSPAGEIRIVAKVTNRIIPGTVGIPQGAWHDADMAGDRIDHGGCVNTIATYRPTPLSKGNGPAHSMIVQVAKA